MSEPVIVDQRGAVREIRINRPERLNALDVPSFETLRVALRTAGLDPAVRAVLLTGAGRAFCAGGDIEAMDAARDRAGLPELFWALTGEQELAVREILSMPKPVVAALPGFAAGGGLSLALACDWRIGVPAVELIPAFPGLGAVPDGGLTYFLPHFLGIGLAQEILFSNARVPADRAQALGLIHEIVEPGRLMPRAWEKGEELASGPTFAFGWMKRLLVSAFSESLESQLAAERRGALEAAQRDELPEGIRAFREKRRPRFHP